MPRLGTPDHPGDRAAVALGGRGSVLTSGTPEEGGGPGEEEANTRQKLP